MCPGTQGETKHSLWETQAMGNNEENYEILMMNKITHELVTL
jgi:hypothetical protein